MNILGNLEKQSKSILVSEGLILVVIIGFFDYLTGHELAFSIFYLLPIFLVAWFANHRLGLLISIASAVVWLIADMAALPVYSSHLVPLWNSLVRLAFFLVITHLLSVLKRSLELARTDHLTSAINSRHFYDLVQMEMNRFQRSQHPFTIAYIDLDNFKSINDRFGHSVGDEVLIILVNSVRNVIRKSDFIARLGGDEFAVLFPETDQDAAQTIFSKIQNSFTEAMQQKNLFVTISVGILTCRAAPSTTGHLVRMADELMYLAKSDGKNKVKYSVYTG